MTDKELLGAIQFELSSREWNADTFGAVAALMNAAGYSILDISDAQTFDDWRAAERYMRALDGSGDSYVVERVKIASGVVLRAKSGPGFDVYTHNADGMSIASDDSEMFAVAVERIASVAVLPL